MSGDYRTTDYCPAFEGISEKKDEVVKLIRKKHPRARDLHALISPNESEYKVPFMMVYNCKCSYCGVSADIIPKDNFEVDHFIYKKNKAKFQTVSEAGYIENLVLACRRCNHHKSSYIIPDEYVDVLHPDLEQIKSVFMRDKDYSIVVAEEFAESEIVTKFHDQLKLGQEVHKLDYLLLKMLGQQSKTEAPNEYRTLGEAISLLRKRRNML